MRSRLSPRDAVPESGDPRRRKVAPLSRQTGGGQAPVCCPPTPAPAANRYVHLVLLGDGYHFNDGLRSAVSVAPLACAWVCDKKTEDLVTTRRIASHGAHAFLTRCQQQVPSSHASTYHNALGRFYARTARRSGLSATCYSRNRSTSGKGGASANALRMRRNESGDMARPAHAVEMVASLTRAARARSRLVHPRCAIALRSSPLSKIAPTATALCEISRRRLATSLRVLACTCIAADAWVSA